MEVIAKPSSHLTDYNVGECCVRGWEHDGLLFVRRGTAHVKSPSHSSHPIPLLRLSSPFNDTRLSNTPGPDAVSAHTFDMYVQASRLRSIPTGQIAQSRTRQDARLRVRACYRRRRARGNLAHVASVTLQTQTAYPTRTRTGKLGVNKPKLGALTNCTTAQVESIVDGDGMCCTRH